MSHTTKVVVSFRDIPALRAAVEAMGGQWIGENKTIDLFSSRECGTVFSLPGWHYPCILTNEGALKFDNYEGRWGDIKALDTLKNEYALSVAAQVAQSQGWYCERVNNELFIHHPEGVIKVDGSGTVDASQFMGASCVSATALIEVALGSESQTNLKAEFYNQIAVVKVAGGE